MEPAITPEPHQVQLRGLGTAVITPFHADESVDHVSLQRLVEAQVAAGVDFLVACGSTGEASTLSEEETAAVVATCIDTAAGRVPVLAGCTHNSTREAVRRAKRLADLPGVYGILSANPYYSKPNQQGQYLHFKAIAEATGKPLLLYNIPGRTAANLEPATALRLGELPNVIGIKESSGNLQQIGELLATAPADFAVFAGDDYLALPVIAGGGCGLVSVTSNVVPQQVAELVRAALAHDMGEARRLTNQLHQLTRTLFAEPNPAPAKALLATMGVIDGDALRLPMMPVSDETRAKLRAAAAPFGLL